MAPRFTRDARVVIVRDGLPLLEGSQSRLKQLSNSAEEPTGDEARDEVREEPRDSWSRINTHSVKSTFLNLWFAF